MQRSTFRAAGYPWRLHCGPEVIESSLGAAVVRAGGRRAMVICSPSVNRRTDTVGRIQAALGDRWVGVYDEIEKDSTYASVRGAADAAEAAEADLLIAAGGGSVIVATRAVAIFLGEPGDPFDLMTQYPEGQPAYSPRLEAPKLPIFNVPTTPTSAMNRAGTGLKNSDLDQRMEYFDPKTRPDAIFIDDRALLSAPPDLIRSTATTVFAGLVGSRATPAANPLAQADQDQAFMLAMAAYPRLMEALDDPSLRVDLALAAFLQNRAEDDGQQRLGGSAFSGNYAVSTALHLRYPEVGQGESTSVIQSTAIRLIGDPALDQARRVAAALGVWQDGMAARDAANTAADELDRVYAHIGVPTRMRELRIERDDLIHVASETVKNFNANAGVRSAEEQIAQSLELLEAAW